MRHLESAGIIVYRKNNSDISYLLLQYLHGHWDFVKGKLEPGENRREAALRELQEETGITVVTLEPNFSKSLSYVYTERDGIVTKKTVHFFVGRVTDTHITLSSEHVDYTWLPLEDALQQLTFKNARDVLTAAHEFILSKVS
jgi:bis(5'-nucleosidyl)-tetraphosphatase